MILKHLTENLATESDIQVKAGHRNSSPAVENWTISLQSKRIQKSEQSCKTEDFSGQGCNSLFLCILLLPK